MLLQLFQNLLSNAIKFQEEGKQPVISINAEKIAGISIDHPDADPGLPYLKINFVDNGIGFKRKYNEQIFEMFMRIGKNRYPGSGTGLTLCKKIAELHGGFITVESTPGAGSTFSCFLQEGL
jgi:signal transduction histidine kinase